MPQAGMLLQVDGSRHQWLGPDGPWLTLVGAIDDATGDVPHAIFREQEDAQGYLLLLREVVRRRGLPLALYSDRHRIFQSEDREPLTLEEELAGKPQPTQVRRVLDELNITWIGARSPQAKGRVERLWRTLQDRLYQELRLANVSTIEQANAALPALLSRHNARFRQTAAVPGSAYRRLPAGKRPVDIFCFRYWRTVSMDNVVSLVHYQGSCIARQSPQSSDLRTKPRGKVGEKPAPQTSPTPKPPHAGPWKPPVGHPWRQYRVTAPTSA
jgi:hypothetical protein